MLAGIGCCEVAQNLSANLDNIFYFQNNSDIKKHNMSYNDVEKHGYCLQQSVSRLIRTGARSDAARNRSSALIDMSNSVRSLRVATEP